MYSKVKHKVRTKAGCSDTLNLTTGLMQGECLSPSLFSSFINDLDGADICLNCKTIKCQLK